MKRVNFKNISMSIYLMLFVVGIVFVVAVVLTLSFFQVFKESLLSIAKINAEQSITQIANTINHYSNTIQKNMDNIVNVVTRSQNQETIQQYMQAITDINNDIVSIMIYDENGNMIEYKGLNSLKNKIENNLSFNKIEDLHNGYHFSSPHVQNISKDEYPWVVSITSKKWSGCYGKEVYIVMDIRFSSMGTAIDEVGIGQHGYSFIVNSQGDMVYHPLQQLLYLDIKEENMDVLQTLGGDSYVENGIIYTAKEIPNFYWKVVGVSYVNELVDAKVAAATKNLIMILVIMILLSSIMVYILLKKLTNPVRSLVYAMHAFENETIDFKYQPIQGVSEFNQLSQSFEHMVKQIQELMERVKNEEITLRKTELKALQAQINPHFLYNTLDSIQWMCERDKTKDAVRMVGALAQLFRISISKGCELIPIEKEIQHAQNYLVIQSYRYKDQFTYDFDIDPEVLTYCCHKITLQPIIENALYHGISRMVDEGRIVITARKIGNDILFSIADNGAGMSEEQVENILSKELTDSKGIGVKNVNDRIKIYFGSEYGIMVESELDVGTTIKIRIPAMREETYE
ncbi:MAG: sensor histidine kinase [Erysipelotrichaceae bacterium]